MKNECSNFHKNKSKFKCIFIRFCLKRQKETNELPHQHLLPMASAKWQKIVFVVVVVIINVESFGKFKWQKKEPTNIFARFKASLRCRKVKNVYDDKSPNYASKHFSTCLTRLWLKNR